MSRAEDRSPRLQKEFETSRESTCSPLRTTCMHRRARAPFKVVTFADMAPDGAHNGGDARALHSDLPCAANSKKMACVSFVPDSVDPDAAAHLRRQIAPRSIRLGNLDGPLGAVFLGEVPLALMVTASPRQAKMAEANCTYDRSARVPMQR
ncbi:uncharacterized protein TRAVEDRAFT_44904 [Trametes versicolor FP-101664 SS1]|uniref:uncharacterized protein n=1 Tax=Trametes versicolor (strain FP-101664) TaxID=717944 RepID=UPI0004621D99|nr:uncharacterized protein TRAVEDRAFT_44904 [Trametes versicolor FP-101664 SS1]EIW62070.1 hypothetical protein TRAVEDRAFT_44904 [Trametes versicolor FP-101664 SS1]